MNSNSEISWSTIMYCCDRIVDTQRVLAMELMNLGSNQIEMSDEGMMANDIEECLRVVIDAFKKGNSPASEVIERCTSMMEMDPVDFICTTELKALRKQNNSS